MTEAINEQKISALLGFAQKAGKIVSGDEMVIAGIKKKQVFFVVLAKNASENACKEVLYYINKYQVPYLIWSDKEQLGYMIGKSPRMALGVTDKNFAAGIQKSIPVG